MEAIRLIRSRDMSAQLGSFHAKREISVNSRNLKKKLECFSVKKKKILKFKECKF